MKKRIVLFITVISILLTGCSNKSENSLVDEGRQALEKHEYKEAKTLLSQALEADSADEYARAMYTQAIKLENAIKYKKQGNYEKAIEELKSGENIKNGSQSIKLEISNMRKELIKLNDEYIKNKEQRKENAKIESGKDRYRVQSLAEKENQNVLEEKKKQEEDKKKEEDKNNTQTEEDKEENNTKNEGKEPETIVSPPASTENNNDKDSSKKELS